MQEENHFSDLDFEAFPEEAGDAEDCKTETPGSKAGSKIEGRP